MDYFEKLKQNPYKDLAWNIPEQKQGVVNVVGGNEQSFRTEVKVAEFLAGEYPLQEVRVVVPEALKGKLPELPNFAFLPSTESGSFAESQELVDVFGSSDYNLVLGDLSKNAVTGRAIESGLKIAEKCTLITRDTVDLLSENAPERVLMNENLTIFASVAQLSKLLKAIYYPKMLLMSASLVQVTEVLHKFTLSYPAMIVTLHNGQILIAESGKVVAMSLEKTGYSPLTLWMGEAAGKIAAMSVYNPGSKIAAAVAAIYDK